MKQLINGALLSVGLVLSASAMAQQTSVTPDIDNPVVGLIGASFVDPLTPYPNAGGLTCLNGCSYRGLSDHLIGTVIREKKGIAYQSAAQAGAISAGTSDYYSVLGQATKLYEHHANWNGDSSRLKAVVFDIFNDCLHNLYGPLCTEHDIKDGVVANVKEAVDYLQARGVKVYLNKYVAYEDLDLPAMQAAFSNLIPGFTAASPEQYDLLKTTYEAELSAIDGVSLLDTWKNFNHVGDGLHPDHKTKRKAAKYVTRTLKKELDLK